jgi:hypothetical protein
MQPAHDQHPIWITLHQAIAQFVDPQDREEYLDAVKTKANSDDQKHGNGAGDAYVARVIQSLAGNNNDGLREP